MCYLLCSTIYVIMFVCMVRILTSLPHEEAYVSGSFRKTSFPIEFTTNFLFIGFRWFLTFLQGPFSFSWFPCIRVFIGRKDPWRLSNDLVCQSSWHGTLVSDFCIRPSSRVSGYIQYYSITLRWPLDDFEIRPFILTV